tara:strand:+ start:2103 stop:2309 length:207 start_codon:yes stop_codon:yes gene_type:complete
MKSLNAIVRDKLVAKYLYKDSDYSQPKTSNINVLLNRIEMNKKNETRKKIYFSAAASTGLILFGLIIF